MSQTPNLQISKSVLARIVATALFPPDYFGPFNWNVPGGGPRALAILWAALNPQPIPPGIIERAEPGDPSPWRAVFEAARIVERSLVRMDLALGFENEKQIDKMLGFVRSEIDEFVKGWCGNEPKPLPWPLLGAGALFLASVEQAKNLQLRTEFENTADKLLQAGIQSMN